MSDMIQMVEGALAKTKNWSTEGWVTNWGTRKTEINNLAEAEATPKEYVYRLEAIAYWKRVKNTSIEAAEWGERCLKALKSGNMVDAVDSAYYAMVVEKPMREKAPTWEPVYHALAAELNKAA